MKLMEGEGEGEEKMKELRENFCDLSQPNAVVVNDGI